MTVAIDAQAVIYSAQETDISVKQVENVLKLIVVEECTVPFIVRYRKERTGGLDEVQIRSIFEAYEGYLEREKRKEFILKTIKEMDKLTPELQKKIETAQTLNQLEDLYAPYKSKRKTKGQKAKEAGLEPLSNILLTTDQTLEELESKHAQAFLNPEHKITSFAEAMAGAEDIIIETFAHDAEIKEELRGNYWNEAILSSQKAKDAEKVTDHLKYKDYFDYKEPIKELKAAKAGHRFLAMRRGLTQKVLKVDVVFDEQSAIAKIENKYINANSQIKDRLLKVAKRAYSAYIHSSLDIEIKSELKKLADESAINVFSVNLKNLLLQPYLGAKTVLGVDPGVRTGCKLALVDETGKFLVDTVIYPHPPQNDELGSAQVIQTFIEKFNVAHIAIGNGTYGRETLEFLESNIDKIKSNEVKATLISEAGASIYSASELARKEFPDKDPTVRGAISIARRFQDPLAELVKIDPKSIGVGQYQHDVNQTSLKKTLEGVVENCVNFVGVDLNTASAPLLSHISGIGPTLATNIIGFREENGGFKSRAELLKVKRFSQKVFEQAAGFLRIYNGTQPLDATFIHPEQYERLETWANTHKLSLVDLSKESKVVDQLAGDKTFEQEVGEFTLKDIVSSLKAPSQDPRTEFKSTDFRKDIKTINDLKIDQWYPGVVTNITQFGAFVDIGIKENGLLHVSQIADRFIENPLDTLKVGESLKVKVLDVDLARKRISLSCKTGESPAKHYDQGSRQSNRDKGNRHKPQQQFKNNAFSALKGFKVK